ncbi:ParB family chromosome partitioning protein [Paraburkholderia sp. MM5477-R1]
MQINLVVHEIKGRGKMPKLGVCAGQRRLAALDLLFSQGRITKDYQVPVLVVSEGEAVAASLIENREREDMHVADEAVAFRLLVDEGKSVTHVAAVFKVSEMVVRRALKIANLSPAMLEMLRDDSLDYEQAKALALADDHATQERVWNEAPNAWQRRPSELRAALTKAEIDARESALAKFVGLDAYEAAGGHVRRDLFSDDQNAGYIEDSELLHRLATDRLVELSQTIAKEGWQFVETRTRGDMMEIMQYGRVHSTMRKPTTEEQAELDALVSVRDTAQAELDAYYDEDREEDEDRYDRLDAAVTAASYAVDQYAVRFEAFDADDMKRAGVLVYLDEDGQVCVERGLVRHDDARRQSDGDSRTDGASASRSAAAKPKPLHGEKLCKRLTAHRTAAVQAELMTRPSVAMAALMTRMVPVVFGEVYSRQFSEHAIRIDAHTSRDALVSNADDMAESVAWKMLEGERAKWAGVLPKRRDGLLAWLLQQEADVISRLFAFCVAATLDGISGTDSAHAINEVTNVLETNMAYYWKPTRASYFDHVPKARIEEVISDALSPEAAAELRGMKKGGAAAVAQLRLSESGWLPEVLRNREVPEHRIYGYDDGEDEDPGDEVDADSGTDEAEEDAVDA